MKYNKFSKEVVIGERKSIQSIFLELFHYRELLYIFAWRDIKLKYRQTILGFTWVVLQPLLMMLVFTSVFASRIDSGSEGFNYSIYVFSGLLVYNVFSNAVSSASNSILFQSNIIKKNYFPRIILPASTILVSAIDYLVSLVILIALIFILNADFSIFRFLSFSILAFLYTIIPTLGFGILFSALNARYRDISFVVPFFLMMMLFVSPIIYPINIESTEFFQFILKLNPLSASIELMKTAVNPNYSPISEVISIGLLVSTSVFIFAIFIFNRIQRNLTDII